jgi:hypothetical protein
MHISTVGPVCTVCTVWTSVEPKANSTREPKAAESEFACSDREQAESRNDGKAAETASPTVHNRAPASESAVQESGVQESAEQESAH